MKPKKVVKPIVHDLRGVAPIELAVSDVSGEFAGVEPLPVTDGPKIVSPSIGNEVPGQATHD